MTNEQPPFDPDATQEYKPEELVEDIIDRVKQKEAAMKEVARESIQGLLGVPVTVSNFEYVGGGNFKVTISVGDTGKSETVIVKETEKISR